MRRVIFAAMVAACLGFGGAAQAQTTDCLVKQAADAALQKQIATLDAAKVNPHDFFSGPNSCISDSLLSRIDLSNLIPDLASLITGAIDSMISNIINAAQQKICSLLNSQLQNITQLINQRLYSFQSQLGGQLSGILSQGGSFTQLQLPNIPGIGQYAMSGSSSSVPDLIPLPSQPAIPAVPTGGGSGSGGASGSGSGSGSGTGLGSGFGSSLFGVTK